jgi:ATP phosphoribosyltransferase regulatory subunit
LPASVPADLLARLMAGDSAGSAAEVQAYLDRAGITEVGVRSVAELTESLTALAEDRRAPPLSPASAALIDRFVGIDVPAAGALAAIQDALGGGLPALGDAIARFERRLSALIHDGLRPERLRFTAAYGRGFAYYTGLVFQFEAPGEGRAGQLAGGGRYDSLLEAAGAPRPVPAVGAAMHSERLLAFAGGAAS